MINMELAGWPVMIPKYVIYLIYCVVYPALKRQGPVHVRI